MSVDSASSQFTTLFQKCIEIENAGQEVSQDLRNSLIEAAKDLVEASAEYLDYDLDDELQVLTEALQEPTDENLKSCQSIGEILLAGAIFFVTIACSSFLDSFFSKLGENAATAALIAFEKKVSDLRRNRNAATSTTSSDENAGGSSQV